MGVTFHVPRSVGECEGMNSHFESCSFDGVLNFQKMILGAENSLD
jgi:hypothetical protein